jgi:hypothetical protein
MHKTLQLKSNLSVTELLNLSKTLNFIDPIYINITNPHFNNFNSLNDTGLYPICKMFINEIKSLSTINNSTENLLNIFPEKAIQFEYFEFSEISNDPSLYEILSTPELKIYYPEPFIASPSFVHEVLWFMHIMHFQHWL